MKLHQYEIIKKILLTEKSSANENQNLLTLAVDRHATKEMVKDAVEKVFSVRVTNVNTLNKRAENVTFKGKKGKRSGFKKAYVTLHDDDNVDVFSQIQGR